MYPAYIQLAAKWSSSSIGDQRATGCIVDLKNKQDRNRTFKSKRFFAICEVVVTKLYQWDGVHFGEEEATFNSHLDVPPPSQWPRSALLAQSLCMHHSEWRKNYFPIGQCNIYHPFMVYVYQRFLTPHRYAIVGKRVRISTDRKLMQRNSTKAIIWNFPQNSMKHH